MNRMLLLAALLGVFATPRPVSAKPPLKCPDTTGELLELFPNSAFAGGVNLERSASTGRYVTDAGLEFDMERATLQAELTGAMPGCEQPSGLLRLDVIDPFTNQTRHVALEVRP